MTFAASLAPEVPTVGLSGASDDGSPTIFRGWGERPRKVAWIKANGNPK